MKNTGKRSEAEFEEVLLRQGKEVYFERLVDAAEVYGRTGKRGFSKPQPSDYIIVIRGSTIFAEVKSTVDPVGLKPSLLKTGQRSHAKRITTSLGNYQIYVHALHLKQWFTFKFNQFPLKATKWEDLGAFKWNI